MSGDQLNLDAYLPDDKTLDRWANGIVDLTGEQAHALVAEVRRLRAELSLRDLSAPVPPDTSPLIGHVYGPTPETPLAFFHLGDYHIRDDGTIVDAP